MVGLTESQWATVRDTLPDGVDETWFRGELERIADDTLSPIWGKAPGADRIKEIVREYRHTFKPGSSVMGGLGRLSADSFVQPASRPSQALRR
jgi:hypothetical protein